MKENRRACLNIPRNQTKWYFHAHEERYEGEASYCKTCGIYIPSVVSDSPRQAASHSGVRHSKILSSTATLMTYTRA